MEQTDTKKERFSLPACLVRSGVCLVCLSVCLAGCLDCNECINALKHSMRVGWERRFDG